MMDMQNLAVLCVIVAAAIYVVRRFFRIGQNKKSASCGACGQCPAAPSGKQLISLDPPKK